MNGTGKTTSIGKLAYRIKSEGKKVMLAAADTFRAGAIQQLEDLGRARRLPRRRQGRRRRSLRRSSFDAIRKAEGRRLRRAALSTPRGGFRTRST
ncbi:MAG: hypothetical protein MZU97_13635 [Bacillus subtilis]|nr:hypothetical protein [Bacillus subtilis]